MRIKRTIRLARIMKCRIKNSRLKMYKQDPKSLVHWLFIDVDHKKESVALLKEYLRSDDWELDED